MLEPDGTALDTGDITKAIAGGSAPYLAEVIHKTTTDDNGNVNKAANLMAHAVVNAALAAAQGNNVLLGAGGAATAEMVGMIATSAYGKPVSELSETEKQTVSALATLAAGLAGGLIGDSSANMVTAAQVGKTTVENNALAVPAPVPVPGVPVGPGDMVKQDADKKIASGLEGAIKDLGDALDKATQCSFGRACSSDGDEQQNQPNFGANLTDAEKAEYGGAGSGTPGGWGPQDEESARNNEGTKTSKNVRDFDAAKDRYPKQYDQYNKLPDKNLEKAISKHDKQIAEHQGYLNDSVKRQEHVPDWNKLSPQHQENLLHHWQQDVNRHEAYKAIAEGILKGRNNGI